MKKNPTSSFRLLAISMLLGLGLYVVYIIYRLSHFKPAGDVSIYIPLYRPEFHPEIDVQLYVVGVIFVPFAGLVFYFLFKHLIGQFLPYIEKFIDWAVIFTICLLNILIVGILFFNFQFFNTTLIKLLKAENYLFFEGFNFFQLVFVGILLTLFFYFWFKPPKIMTQIFSRPNVFYLIDGIVLLLIILSVLVVATNGWGSSLFVISNYNPVIGPVNDVIGGKSLLVDINSQYGLFHIYFLAILFKFIPLSYQNFFWLNLVTSIGGYFLLYLIMKKWLGKIAFLGILLIIQHHYFGGNINLLLTSQQTFIRWGWWIILLSYILFTDQRRMKGNLKIITEFLLLGIAFYWGFDMGVYTLGAYMGYAFTKILVKEINIRKIMVSIVSVAFTLFLFFISISLYTFLRSGVWPDWGRYNTTAGLFMTGWGMMPLPVVGGYWIYLGLYLGLVSYILYCICIFRRKREGDSVEDLPIITYITVYALLSFVYYIGRSTSSYLHTLVLPFILLVLWLLVKTKKYYQRKGLQFNKIRYWYLAVLFIVSATIMTTVGSINMVNAYKKKDSFFSLQFDKVARQEKYRQSIEAINTYLNTQNKKRREVGVISMRDGFFLVETRSVNMISSNHMDYFTRLSQLEELARQLLSQSPDVFFTDHINNFETVPIIQGYLKEKYHFSKNVGYLDEWVRNE